MQGIDSYLARSKYHLTIKNLACTHFYGPPDSGGLVARLLTNIGFVLNQIPNSSWTNNCVLQAFHRTLAVRAKKVCCAWPC